MNRADKGTLEVLAMFGLGTGEIIAILAVGLVFFGARRLPALGKGLGEGLRGFRDSLRGITDDEDDESPKVVDSGKSPAQLDETKTAEKQEAS